MMSVHLDEDKLVKKLLLSGLLALTLGLVSNASADQHCFYFGDPSGRDVVKFTSDAPVELIEGQTNKITGKACYNDDGGQVQTSDLVDVDFNVDLSSVDTGIPLRNDHMRDNYLETDKFPMARFKASAIKMNKQPTLDKVEVVDLRSDGQFTIHGETVKKATTLKVTYLPESPQTKQRFKSGNLVRLRGSFPVTLTQHNIKRPEALFVKLADTVYVTIDAMGTDDKAALAQ